MVNCARESHEGEKEHPPSMPQSYSNHLQEGPLSHALDNENIEHIATLGEDSREFDSTLHFSSPPFLFSHSFHNVVMNFGPNSNPRSLK